MRKPWLPLCILLTAPLLLVAGCASTQLTDEVSANSSTPPTHVQPRNEQVDAHLNKDGSIAFTGPFPTHNFPFPVKDSGVEVRIDGNTTIEWLDEDRVIFSALAKGEPRLQGALGARKQYPGRTVVWNTKTGKVTDLGKGELWCSHGGKFTIWYKGNDGKPWLKKGSLNNFHVIRGWRKGDPVRHQDKHTCTLYDGPQKKVAPKDHVVFRLREQDGFLDTGSRNTALAERKAPVVLIRPDGTRKALSLLPTEMNGVWWEEWAGVYLLAQSRDGMSSWPIKHDTVPYLTSDGTLVKWRVPDAYWHHHTIDGIALTKRGWLLANKNAPIGHWKSDGSLYLARDRQAVPLTDGFIGNRYAALYGLHRGIAVSPSGCRVAFKHADIDRTHHPDTTPHTIQMIDVCQGE